MERRPKDSAPANITNISRPKRSPKNPHHRFVKKAEAVLGNGDHVPGEVILVRGGKRAYLWVGSKGGTCLALASGEAELRALAQAILKEVGP